MSRILKDLPDLKSPDWRFRLLTLLLFLVTGLARPWSRLIERFSALWHPCDRLKTPRTTTLKASRSIPAPRTRPEQPTQAKR